MLKSKFKIVSDGTTTGTKLIDPDTGQTVGLVQSIEWKVDVDNFYADAVIKILAVPVELEVKNVVIEEVKLDIDK